MNTKVCRKCGEEKELGEFWRDSAKRDGLSNRCKQCGIKCNSQYAAKNKERNLLGTNEAPTIKICSRCNTGKSIDQFSRDSSLPDGYDSRCKQCRQDYFINQYLVEIKRRRESGECEIPETKVCTKCRIEKDIGEFHIDSSVLDGHTASCKQCIREIARQKEFGLSTDQYKEMVEQQGNKCAICGNAETAHHQNGKVRSLSIDHSHVIGTVRELLCYKCNSLIGLAHESPEILRVAANYLEKWNSNIPS